MIVWRIATASPSYAADDLSGEGARRTGGRWNSPGMAVVYTSSTIALAVLETVVHLSSSGLPLHRYLIHIDIPEDLWTRREEIDPANAVAGWDALPASTTSAGFGDAWLRSQRSAILSAPSVVVPDEKNVLINPAHPDARHIVARQQRRWTYDPRLF